LQGWNWYGGSDPTQIGSDQYDFQTVVTHELGHALGLGGSSDSTSPMFELLAAGVVRRSPTAADLNIPETPDSADPERAAPVPPLDGSAPMVAAINLDLRPVPSSPSTDLQFAMSARVAVAVANAAVQPLVLFTAPAPDAAGTHRASEGPGLMPDHGRSGFATIGTGPVRGDSAPLGSHRMSASAMPAQGRAAAVSHVFQELVSAETRSRPARGSLWNDFGADAADISRSCRASRTDAVQLSDCLFAAAAISGMAALPSEFLAEPRRREVHMSRRPPGGFAQ
jgi:hypothetical protein